MPTALHISSFKTAVVLSVALIIVYLFFPVTTRSLTEPITQSRQDYRYQLEQYQSAYQDFQLRKTQNQNLQTFATQEQLINSTRTLLEHRAEVWWTYLQSLRIELIEIDSATTALESTQTIESLVLWQSVIRSHSTAIPRIDSIEASGIQANYLNSLSPDLNALAYQSLGTIRVVRLSQALVAQESLIKELTTAAQNQIRNTQSLEIRQRGLTQAQNRVVEIDSIIQDLYTDTMEINSDSYDHARSFQRIITQSNQINLELTSLRLLIVELSQGLHL